MSLIIGLGRTILFKKTANQVSQQNDIVICTCNMNCLVNDLQNCDTQSFHYFLELFDMSVFSPTVCKNFIILFFITHSLHFLKILCNCHLALLARNCTSSSISDVFLLSSRWTGMIFYTIRTRLKKVALIYTSERSLTISRREWWQGQKLSSNL